MSGAQGRATQRCARWEVACVNQDSGCKMQRGQVSGYGLHSHFQHFAPLMSSLRDPGTPPGRRRGLYLLHRTEREACEPLGECGVSLLTLSPALRRPCSLHLDPCPWAQRRTGVPGHHQWHTGVLGHLQTHAGVQGHLHRQAGVPGHLQRHAAVSGHHRATCEGSRLPLSPPSSCASHRLEPPCGWFSPQALGRFWGWDPGHYGAETRHPTVAFLCSQHARAMSRITGCFSSLILGWYVTQKLKQKPAFKLE